MCAVMAPRSNFLTARAATTLGLLLLVAAAEATAAQSDSSRDGTKSQPNTAAAAVACPDQPVSISPAALNSSSSSSSSNPAASAYTTCRVLVVGGGAAGMFSAYMLREMGSSVCVVEQQRVWGGKLQAVGRGNSSSNHDTANNAVIGTAGLWIHGSQNIRCLAQELNVTLATNIDDYLVHARGQWARGGGSNLLTTQNGTYAEPAFNLMNAEDAEDLQERLWGFVLGQTATNPLTGETPNPHPAKACADYQSMGHYINSTVGPEAYAFLIVDMPEPGNFQLPEDVCAWIESEVFQMITMETDDPRQRIPHGGWHGLLERARAVAMAAGVRFFLDSPIACISSVANASSGAAPPVAAADAVNASATAGNNSRPVGDYQFAATGAGGHGRVFLSEHLIFASGPLDVRKVGGDIGRQLAAAPETASIMPVPVVVYDAFYPQRFWDRYSAYQLQHMPVRSDASCLVFSELPGHPYYLLTNATRPVYCTDLPCIAFWKQLYAASGMEGVRSYVHSSLQQMFPLEQVPAPYLDVFVDHPAGWHNVAHGATQRNVTLNSIYTWAAAPLGEDVNLCLVGEAYYGLMPGWTAGAWMTAHRCIKERFAQVLSGAALDAVEFIGTGCGGQTRFPNEIVLPTNVSGPGLNPATGRVLKF